LTMPRLSVTSMMSAVVVAGVAFAIVRVASPAALMGLYTFTFLALLLAVVAARCRGAFWFGFAVFGWGYFLIGIAPWSEWQGMGVSGHGTFVQPRGNSMFPTTGWIETFAESQSGHLKPENYGRNITVSAEEFQVATAAIAAYQGRKPSLVGIGHLLFTLAFGAAGGVVASWMASKEGRQ
jgi:hypothetical protein